MTYTEDQMTEWYPKNTTPVHHGWYQVRIHLKGESYFLTHYFWTGKDWCYLPYGSITLHQRQSWRGLREKAE